MIASTSVTNGSFEFHTLNGLARALEYGARSGGRLEVVGFDRPEVLAMLVTQELPVALQRPMVFVFADESAAADFESAVRFFSKTARVLHLPSFDISPYSGLYPSPRTVASRLHWLWNLGAKTPNSFFTATVESLSQRTIPRTVLSKSVSKYLKGQSISETLADDLVRLGYSSAPLVEDIGSFAIRGSVVDIFSPAHALPLRFDLFGDTIESIRFFNPADQRSTDELTTMAVIVPAKEFLLTDDAKERASQWFKLDLLSRKLENAETRDLLQSLALGHLFPGIDFLLPAFHTAFETPLDHAPADSLIWMVNPIELTRAADTLQADVKRGFESSLDMPIAPAPNSLYRPLDQWIFDGVTASISVSKILFSQNQEAGDAQQTGSINQDHHKDSVRLSTVEIRLPAPSPQSPLGTEAMARLQAWRQAGETVFLSAGTLAQCQRLRLLLDNNGFQSEVLGEDDFNWLDCIQRQTALPALISIVPRPLSVSFRLPDEKIVFLRDEDFFGRKTHRRDKKVDSQTAFKDATASLAFSDLEPGDRIVHSQHGIGLYEGLKLMSVNGIEAEFLTLSYKGGDKLYLPIYRISQVQKYSGPGGEALIDKLGGIGWAKTKIKVRGQLRELAGDLLLLYAKRAQTTRHGFPGDELSAQEFSLFEAAFPYDETEDQLKAIGSIVDDMTSDKPMDRLICGDVGFGKTEVAMRAAFKAIQGRRQIGVLAPTTVLCFQHLETFQKRFKNWPVVIRALNRFIPPADQRKTLNEIKEGKVDIVIGTHRMLSKDLEFKDLGLLIIDEEQRFGVSHKEKIRKLRVGVDTLTLSATPIPRTLNMSLVGIRDLSLINTPPIDRLPTRTFVCKYDEETIRRGILSEIQRGGQVFFLHNRVQSIYGVADELRRLVPEARIRVGHGQMEEHELEATMIAFFSHEIDVLLSTTIIESGIDNPRANTMFIDNAHQLGLSQLYQLRGRVGRSKERAYCYLLVPQNKRLESDAQERLKVIQENTALGSGITIAHHDLELRGAGNLLGEDQSGHIEAVGYETYLELLEETIRELKGEDIAQKIEPDINVRIQALIPDTYVPDIRIRLAWYRSLAQIQSPEDVDRMEERLTDQFGRPPEPVINLLGLMLIRSVCRDLGIRDLSSGPKAISLAFTNQTRVPPTEIIKLAAREKGRVALTPDMRLNIRMDTITWPKIYEELVCLQTLCAT